MCDYVLVEMERSVNYSDRIKHSFRDLNRICISKLHLKVTKSDMSRHLVEKP